MSSARVFLNGIIDYAGLFPPASLEMNEAVAEYATHRAGSERDLIGRFVVRSDRLDELSAAAEAVFPRGADPWRVSAVAGPELSSASESMLHFNCRHGRDSPSGHAVCDAVEVPVRTHAEVARAVGVFPGNVEIFLEVAPDDGVDDVIAAIGETRAAAKIRTGGVTADAIPSSADVLKFIRACKRHDVRFKATAGLHHAIRARYPLTYDRNAPTAVMFGYLNVFLAAAFLEAGLSDEMLLHLLDETDAATFHFDDTGASWRDNRISIEMLRRARQRAVSFGSCSFREPAEEASHLGLI